MYHVEMRQRPNVARAFNLSEADLRAQFLEPLLGGRPFEYAGHQWDGRKLRLTIFDGRRLSPNELLLGRGWSNAQKFGSDVTEQILARVRSDGDRRELAQRLGERIVGRIAAGPLELDAALALSDDLLAGHPARERYAVIAQAVWELLHRGQADLVEGQNASPIGREEWEPRLLGWATASGAGDQATTSAISLVRSSSEANR